MSDSEERLNRLVSQGWRPIDTAPDGNVPILIGRYEFEGENIGWWWVVSGEFEEGRFFSSFNDDFYPLTHYHTATHWRPLDNPAFPG